MYFLHFHLFQHSCNSSFPGFNGWFLPWHWPDPPPRVTAYLYWLPVFPQYTTHRVTGPHEGLLDFHPGWAIPGKVSQLAFNNWLNQPFHTCPPLLVHIGSDLNILLCGLSHSYDLQEAMRCEYVFYEDESDKKYPSSAWFCKLGHAHASARAKVQILTQTLK